MTNKRYVSFALGKRIAHLRKQKGLSQLEFALESGLAKSYLCELESGKRNPSLFVLEKVCLALGITLSALFEGVGPISPEQWKRLTEGQQEFPDGK